MDDKKGGDAYDLYFLAVRKIVFTGLSIIKKIFKKIFWQTLMVCKTKRERKIPRKYCETKSIK